jgi:hypothetical membrane protein
MCEKNLSQKNNSDTGNPEGKLSPNRIFATYWISIVGVILYVVLDAVAQALPPHYSPIRQAESDLAVGPYWYIMTINFVNRGILSLAFVYAFTKTLGLSGVKSSSSSLFKNGSYLLGFGWGVGAILLAFFPTDVPATPISWHGAIHLVVAIIAFICGALGTLVLSRHFGEANVTKGAKKFALPLGWLSVFLLLVDFLGQFLVPRLATRIGGLTERLFLGSVMLWILVVSVYMVSRKRSIFLESSNVSK